MNRSVFRVTTVMLAGVAAASHATAGERHLAQAPSGDRPPTFPALDQNADGRIDLDEASVNDKLFVVFEKLDKDRDGMLTQEEFAAYRQARTGA